MNLIIKKSNEAKLRHGLDHLVEPLLPTKEDILDMYSNNILEEWLNLAPYEDNPHHKPNKRFEHLAQDIVFDHEILEKQEREDAEFRASITSRYEGLKEDIPRKVLYDEDTGEVSINPEFNQWLSDVRGFIKDLEREIKILECVRTYPE